MQARRKMPLVMVWQRNAVPEQSIPTWVGIYTKVHGDGLLFIRDSSAHAIRPGDWLVRETNGDVSCYTDLEFRAAYELT